MGQTYRITVKGALSERFCLGIAEGMSRRVEADRTVLEGVPAGRSVADLVRALGNLGVEVIDAGPVAPHTSIREER